MTLLYEKSYEMIWNVDDYLMTIWCLFDVYLCHRIIEWCKICQHLLLLSLVHASCQKFVPAATVWGAAPVHSRPLFNSGDHLKYIKSKTLLESLLFPTGLFVLGRPGPRQAFHAWLTWRVNDKCSEQSVNGQRSTNAEAEVSDSCDSHTTLVSSCIYLKHRKSACRDLLQSNAQLN